MDIVLHFPRLRRILLAMWLFCTLAGLCVELWKYVLLGGRGPITRFLGLSYEQNFPSWYSASLLLLCALVLAGIAMGKSQSAATFVTHWWGLAAAFLYISLDETVQIHENFSLWFDLPGILYFGWVIPASVFVVCFVCYYRRFLGHLPVTFRHQFILAGAVYVGGALGVEFALGYWTELAGTKNLIYGLIDLVEESLELLGVTLFLFALIQYIGRPGGGLYIALTHAPQRERNTEQHADSCMLVPGLDFQGQRS